MEEKWRLLYNYNSTTREMWWAFLDFLEREDKNLILEEGLKVSGYRSHEGVLWNNHCDGYEKIKVTCKEFKVERHTKCANYIVGIPLEHDYEKVYIDKFDGTTIKNIFRACLERLEENKGGSK